MGNNLLYGEHLTSDYILARHEDDSFTPRYYPCNFSDQQWEKHDIKNQRALARREKGLQDQRILDDLILSIQKASKTQELLRSIQSIVQKRLTEQETLKKKEKAKQDQKENMALKAASKSGDLTQVIRVLKLYPNLLEEFTIYELNHYIILLSECAKRSKGSLRKNIEATRTILMQRRELLS